MPSDDTTRIADLMSESGVAFGTSGARGLADAMTNSVCEAYTIAFLQHLQALGSIRPGDQVMIAEDFRPSSPRIAEACATGAIAVGARPVRLGPLPTPALALAAMRRGAAGLMVTGSHIPDNRNGIKFYRPDGEISKADEEAIRQRTVRVPPASVDTPIESPGAHDTSGLGEYIDRYLGFFPSNALLGMRVGLYEHSTVARDPLAAILEGLGAEVARLGRSSSFVPVDTEAIRPEDVELARGWASGGELDAIVSADGDGDRPLVGDEHGEWLRGDIAAVLCARYLGIRTLVTPISSNTVVERCGLFSRVLRTRIGSPYVIAGMEQERDRDAPEPIAGYEANGGFLLASDIEKPGRRLVALPTRDAAIVILGVLLLAREQEMPISALAHALPSRYTASDRLENFPSALSKARLAELGSGDAERDRDACAQVFGGRFGPVTDVDTTDGVRITFENGEIAHLRASGNAPELRAYTEADSAERAQQMNRACLQILEGWRS